MADVQVRWVGRPGGGVLVVVTLVTCIIWVAVRQWVVPEGRMERWAELPAGVSPALVPAARPPRASDQALCPQPPPPRPPPTWQQERDSARSDLRTSCREARTLATWSEQYDAPSPAGAARAKMIHAALLRASEEEARIEAQLDRARGFRDVDAAQREIGGIRTLVHQTQLRCCNTPHLRRPWPGGRRRDQARGAPSGGVRALPPAPGRKGAGHRR